MSSFSASRSGGYHTGAIVPQKAEAEPQKHHAEGAPTEKTLRLLSRREKQEPEAVLSVRRVIWLALSRPEKLTQEQTQELVQVCAFSAQIATALTLAQEFVTMLREKRAEALPSWLESAQVSSVRELRPSKQ